MPLYLPSDRHSSRCVDGREAGRQERLIIEHEYNKLDMCKKAALFNFLL